MLICFNLIPIQVKLNTKKIKNKNINKYIYIWEKI